jgi:hypothetical protein
VEQGEKLSRVLLHYVTVLNFGSNIMREAFDEMLVLTWG